MKLKYNKTFNQLDKEVKTMNQLEIITEYGLVMKELCHVIDMEFAIAGLNHIEEMSELEMRKSYLRRCLSIINPYLNKEMWLEVKKERGLYND